MQKVSEYVREQKARYLAEQRAILVQLLVQLNLDHNENRRDALFVELNRVCRMLARANALLEEGI